MCLASIAQICHKRQCILNTKSVVQIHFFQDLTHAFFLSLANFTWKKLALITINEHYLFKVLGDLLKKRNQFRFLSGKKKKKNDEM